MTMFLVRAAVGAGAYVLLDALWLGLVMKGFYREQLGPIARMANGSMAPNWPSAFVVYVLLGVGVAVFVVPRAGSALAAAGYGALFGLVAYGVYDFTNFCTLRDYPLALTIVDWVWGGVTSACCAAAVSMVGRP